MLAGLLAAVRGEASVSISQVTTPARNVRGAFLSQGMGARPVGMGEAYTAVSDDASGLAWNPGGLAQLNGLGAVVMHDLVGESMGLSYAAFAAPVGAGVAGLSLAALNFGAYDVRNAQGVKTNVENLTNFAATAGWGFRNPGWLGAKGWSGLEIEYVGEAPGSPMVGFGAGSVIPVAPGFAVGWTVQHLGAAQDGFSLPAVVKGGVSYASPGFIRLALDGGYPLVDRQPWVAAGVEVRPQAAMALRAGYKWRSQDKVLGGMTGLTAGIGFQIGRFGLDYAYQPFGDIVTSHRVSLVYGLGRPGPVDAVPAPRAQRPAAAAPVPARKTEALFVDAADLAAAGDNKAALSKLRALLKLDPKHWKGWHLAGNCLEAEGNHEKAVKAWRYSLKLHPDNPRLKAYLDAEAPE